MEQGLHPEIGKRLKRIRALCGFGGRKQKAFAVKVGFEPQTYNHWEKGRSMPWWQGAKLVNFVPGLTLDYIYLGRMGGLPFDLARRLEASPANDR